MFDYNFIKLLLKFVEYHNYCYNYKTSYHMMETLVRNNFTKIRDKKTSPIGNNSVDEFYLNYRDFIRYYDNWYFSF